MSPLFQLLVDLCHLFLSLRPQECYDSKPRIISERCKDNHTICSNMDVVHNFDANKWVRWHRTSHPVYSPSHVISHALNTRCLFLFSVPVRCLVFVVRFTHVKYTKVRPLSVMCHLNLCHPAIRYSCLKEDSCLSAHSPIELKTWRLQQDTGAVCQTHAEEMFMQGRWWDQEHRYFFQALTLHGTYCFISTGEITVFNINYTVRRINLIWY